ncbi:trigger factor [Candidatus Aerophobetes bacterium]|nr:trigger factor [Candidatus Aerophobetes bacterium]
MQIKVNKKEKSQLDIEVEVPVETVEKVFLRAFKKLAYQVEVPGFRRGKIPRKIFEQRYGKEPIKEEAIKELYPLVYKKVLEQEKINPFSYPRMEVIKLSEGEPALIKLEIPLKPEIKIGQYKKIKVKRKKIEVSDKEITQQLERLQKNYVEYSPLLENRPTRKGDWLALQMRLILPDKPFVKTKEENIWYKLGSDQLPSSFHRELLGAKIGDEKIIETTLPPDHPRKDLAGKKLSFNVKVKDIRKEKMPLLNDDFAKKLNFKDMKSLKEKIKEEIRKIKEKEEEERIKTRIIEKILENSDIEIPSLLIQRGIEDEMDKLKEQLKKRGLDLPSYLKQQNMDEEKLRKLFKDKVEMELKTLLLLDEIAKKEKIDVTEEEVDKRLEMMVEGENKKEKIKHLKEELAKKNNLNSIIYRIRNEKVIDFLYQQADISGGILLTL